MKKILAAALLLCLLAALAAPALADTPWGTSIMYVKTENGKSVNVRSSPNLGDNIIGSAPYGHDVLVDWSYAGNDGWTKVIWGSLGDGYIMSRYLVDYKPGPYTPSKEQKEKEEAKDEQKSCKRSWPAKRLLQSLSISLSVPPVPPAGSISAPAPPPPLPASARLIRERN